MDMISGIRARAATDDAQDDTGSPVRPALSDRLQREFSLLGRTAVVTGAASGIGRETALIFAEAGADLVLADRNAEALDDTVTTARATGARVTPVACDVSVRSDVNRIAIEAVKTHGHLDIWANVAGIIRNCAIVEATEDDLEQITKVNLWGTYWGIAAAARAMKMGGSIINVSSAGGEMPAPTLSIYAMTKAAVAHLTRCAAAELGPQGIRVNAIAPGFTDTPMVQRNWTRSDGSTDDETRSTLIEMRAAQSPLGLTGVASDQALAMLYLAADASRFVTGQVVRANGGAVMA